MNSKNGDDAISKDMITNDKSRPGSGEKKRGRKKGKKHSKNRSKSRSAQKYWLAIGAMGAMVAYAAVDKASFALAYSRPTAETACWQDRAQSGPSYRFDISPGQLDSVLNSYQKVTGFQVLVPLDDLRGILSPGVTGVQAAEQALKRLLAGTGVTYRFTGAEIVTLEVSGPAESVNVAGRTTIVSSPKYTETLSNTPQTITVIPRAVIEEQGATTLRDVLRNVPGLTITAGEGGAPAGDNLTLRGFSARNDVFVDGVRDLSPQARDPFNLEQVEVVKGPGSAYTGRGSTGGIINLVSKAPTLDPVYGFTLNLGTDKTRRLTGDIDVPLDRIGLGDRTAFRFNFLVHESDVAGRDVVENDRCGLAPSLAFGLGTPTRLTFSYFKLKQDNLSDYGIPWVPVTNNALVEFRDKPAPVPRETFYGLSSRDKEELNSDLGTIRFERSFGDSPTLTNQFRYGRSTRDSMATPPRFASNDSTVINREMRSWLTEDEIWDNQTDVRANFSTGRVEHALVGGLALSRERNERGTRTAPNMPTTLLNPNPDDVFPGTITVSPIVGVVTGNSIAAYAFNTAKIGSKLDLSGGLRWDYFDVDGTAVTGAPVARIDRMLSWRASAVYRPVSAGNIYAAYGTSLNPSLEGLSYGTANTAIDPEKTYTVEIGTKWETLSNRLSVSGAMFRVDKTNARTPGLPGEPPQVLDGEQRVYGLEVGVSGLITREWNVFASYTFLDSEIVESNTIGELGKELQNTPRNAASIWTTYLLPRRINVGGGLRFVDKRFGNNINTRWVDSYYAVDAMASVPVHRRLDLRLNLYNLNDAYYFDRLGGGHLVPGPGRSASLSTAFQF